MHYLYIYTRNILTNESYSNGDQSSQNTGYFQGRTVNWEVSHHVKSQIVRHSVPWMKSPNHTKIPIFDGETCHNCTHGVLVSRFL